MATFVGTSDNDVANAADGVLTGFTGGTLAELQDAIGDTITGGAGADTVVAGSGNDTINLANGDFVAGESIDGGAGTDAIVLSNGSTTDFRLGTVVNMENLISGSGAEMVEMTADQFRSFSLIDLGTGTDTLNIRVSGVFDFAAGTTPTLLRVNNAHLFGTDGDETVTLTGAQILALTRLDFLGGTDSLIIKTSADFLLPGTIQLVTIENRTIIDDGGGHNITGSSSADTIIGNGGNDIINGGSGNDRIVATSGGDGADIYDGGNGNDTADYSAVSNDLIVALNGATAATVTVIGGEDDTIVNIEHFIGGSGNDQITGDGLKNQLFGGAGDDTIDGGAGTDTLDGGSGNDTIYGGDGSDVIAGGAGDDTLDGGAANDKFNLANGDFAAGESIDGGAGTDTIVLTSDTATIDFSLGTIANIENLISGAGVDTINMTAAQFQGFSSIDAGMGDDTLNVFVDGSTDFSMGTTPILSSIANVHLFGSDSDNTVTITGEQLLKFTSLDFGAGVDSLIIKTTADFALPSTLQLVGIENRTIIDDGSGHNITGSSSADTIIGNGGNDTLYGDDGNDTLYGGEGNDTIDAGAGDDTIDGGFGSDIISGGIGNDTINSGTANDRIVATSGSDGADLHDGGGGTDTADYSAVSNDLIVTLNGATPTTVTVIGGDNDTIVNIENFIGGSGNDRITGDGLKNQLSGGAGDDMVDGGSGDDRIIATSGDDGSDFYDGGTGYDTADYSAVSNDLIVTLNGATPTTVTVVGGDNDTIVNIERFTGGFGNDTITGDGLKNALLGGDGHDTINGLGGSDTLDGGAGDDTLVGGHGSDTIAGGDGNDTISGGNDADVITAGAGDDIMDGGSGDDTFVFNDAFGHDTITAFGDVTGNNDVIEFSSSVFATFAEVQAAMQQVGNAVVVTLDGANTITLNNATLSSLDADDFRFV